MVIGGGDGVNKLIDPAVFPCRSADLDIEVIQSAAQRVRGIGEKLDARVDEIARVWKGLPQVYRSPEGEAVYGLMVPAATRSEEIKQNLVKAAGFIDGYANQLSNIKPDLASFESRALVFREKALKGYDHEVKVMSRDLGPVTETRHLAWDEFPSPYVDENNALVEEYAAILARIMAAAADCADGVRKLVMGEAMCVRSAARYTTDEIMSVPGGMVWGGPAEARKDCLHQTAHGVGEFAGESWDGLTEAVNDPMGALRGTADLVVSAGVSSFVSVGVAVPATRSGTMDFVKSNTQLGGWVRERLFVVAMAGSNAVEYDLVAELDPYDGKNGQHKWEKAPATAATKTLLNFSPLGLLRLSKLLKRRGMDVSKLSDWFRGGGYLRMRQFFNQVPVFPRFQMAFAGVPVNRQAWGKSGFWAEMLRPVDRSGGRSYMTADNPSSGGKADGSSSGGKAGGPGGGLSGQVLAGGGSGGVPVASATGPRLGANPPSGAAVDLYPRGLPNPKKMQGKWTGDVRAGFPDDTIPVNSKTSQNGPVSDLGPGEWKSTNRGMSAAAAGYQHHVSGVSYWHHSTGKSWGTCEYVVQGKDGPVEFDGHVLRDRGTHHPQETYLEAKYGYDWILQDTKFHQRKREEILEEFWDQMRKQLRVIPKGAKLEWHFSDKRVADLVRARISKELGRLVDIYWNPAPGSPR